MSQPRSSPFRRAASPGSPTAYRGGTPPSTSRAQASPLSSPSKLKQSYTVSEEEDEDDSVIVTTPTKTRPMPSARLFAKDEARSASRVPSGGMANDTLSRLPPALLASLRESFSVLDSAGTGAVDPQSVRETLTSLGLSTNDMSQLFPPGQPQQITLPQYLNSMANVLVNLSPPQELLNAFSAFDDDDSGQVDVAELRRALLTTPPEHGEPQLTERDIDDALRGFTGRRTLGRSAMGMSGVRGVGSTPASVASRKGGEVFRYHEFVNNLSGGPAVSQDMQPSTRVVAAGL